MNRKNIGSPKGPTPRKPISPPPVKTTKDWNKEKDWKVRKDRERRAREEKKAIANKPARQKRWKELYETGTLEDDGVELVEDDALLLDRDAEENPV